jgi:tetratricopeptide (TPR) repeat protein
MRLGFVLALLAAMMLPFSARAEWLEASSANFVVYADDSRRDILKFSEQLERYHAALAFLTGTKLETPSPSNRVTVYVVRSQTDVQKIHGDASRYLGGFYLPRAGGSIAIVPSVATGTTSLDFSMTTLLHEYAHHFMISTSRFPMPRWYSEGGAEFFSAATFPASGGISIGRPATHRAAELLIPSLARDVKAAELLDPPEQSRSKGYDAFYGKSWLLFHYLTFDETRKGQIERYIRLLTGGKNARDAALEAFGDAGKLEQDLDAYLRRPRLSSFNLKPEAVPTGPVALRPLSPGEVAMMPVRIRSKRGVDEKAAKALLADARGVAARFPADPAVLAALAEAEHDAGNDREAIVAADAAIASDPAQVNAHVQKGLSLFRMAASAPDRPEAYRKVRVAFVALNRREPDHPLPLIYYYRTFVSQGLPPPDLALAGLEQAAGLAPFDLGLKMTLASEQVRRRQFDAARQNLGPIAYNPHGGELAAAAQRLLAKLDAEPGWDGKDFAAIVGAADALEGE